MIITVLVIVCSTELNEKLHCAISSGPFNLKVYHVVLCFQFYPDLLKEKIWVMTCTFLFVILPLCVIICMSIYILRFMRVMRNKTKSVLEKNDCKVSRTPGFY